MIVYEDAARKMAEGGVVRNFQQGGFNPFQVGTQAVVYGPDGQQYGNSMIAERAGVTDVSYTQPDRRPFNVPVGGDVAFGGAPVGRPSDMEQFPIADFQPMPQQVDTPTGLPADGPLKFQQGISIQPGLGGGDYSTFVKDPRNEMLGLDEYGRNMEDMSTISPGFREAQKGKFTGTVTADVGGGSGPTTLLTYQDRERQRQQAEEERKRANNFGLPQSYIDTNYKTNDGTKFIPPFEPNISPLKLYPTEESYRNYIANQVDEQVRQTEERRKTLEASGYVENAPDERGYIYYTKPGSNVRIGMPPRIADLNAFKQQRIQESLQQRQERIDEAAKYGDERLAFGERFGRGPEDIARSITSAKQGLQERNNRLVGIGLQPIDSAYYDSPEYRYYLENESMVSMPASGFSKYFGPTSQQDPTGGAEKAYEAYLKRTGKESIIQNANRIRKSLGNNPPMFTQDRLLIDPNNPPSDDNIKPADRQNPITGGAMTTRLGTQPIPTQSISSDSDITDVTAQRLSSPGLPQGTEIQGVGIGQEQGQFIPTDQGQVSGSVAVPTAQATTTMAKLPVATDANLMYPVGTTDAINTTLNATQAAQTNPADQRAQITAAQQTASSVGNLQAAQGNATLLNNPVQRQIQSGELVSGVANAQTASAFTEQIQAATASPSEKATVQGQLASLYANFDATNPPAWAAGALRSVQSVMQQRGLGASSIAAQAMVQGALESALPIAQADARTVASFEAQNLSNRQQRAMLSAQQRATFIGQEFDQAFQARVQNASRIADVANTNFNADQQIALENSRIANTMNLQNLSNNQALVIAEASALANMDLSNLNNRQQAAVQNAQTFLQQDMANLSNQQQVELFKAQQRVQSLFTDQAAQNASRQFNASSQNQVDQFFANLITQAGQFNATQANAQSQYNAGQRNVLERFNAELNNQRDTFNAQNRLVIDQNNAQWRRQIATADTATTNRINELNANNLLGISNLAYNNLWQYYSDTMEWAWTSAENELNRYADMSIANLNADTQSEVAKRGAETSAGSAIGSLIGTLGSAYIASSFCWVAREVYGKGNPSWFVFRMWIKYKAPKWFNKLYEKHGKAYASYISNKPKLKWLTKKFMDFVINNERLVSYA
jgi:hypothetical protein